MNNEKYNVLKIISSDYYYIMNNLVILNFKNHFAIIIILTQNNVENILSSNFDYNCYEFSHTLDNLNLE